MTQGDGKGISSIGLWFLVQAKQYPDHMLNLLFCSMAFTHSGLFYLVGSIFKYLEIQICARRNGATPGLSQLEGGIRILMEKDFFYGGLIRLICTNNG